MFFKKKNKVEIDLDNLPKHVAFICDGNRRWAKSKGLPTLMGHKEGSEAIKRIIARASEINLENMTFFCFSTENFNRTKEEVDYLFDLFRELAKMTKDFLKYDYRFHHVGDKNMLPKDLVELIKQIEKDTKKCKRGVVNIALAYGGRHDIVCATKQIIKNKINAKDVNEEMFKEYLSTNKTPDVDLLVRTSGEKRISGFMLYDMAYAELLFVDKHWPAFKGEDLDECIIDYQQRNRRFGR